jgi:hypothetical protein
VVFRGQPGPAGQLLGPTEAGDVADLGDEHRGQDRPDPVPPALPREWNPAQPKRHRATCHTHTAQPPPKPAAHDRIKIRMSGAKRRG